MQVSDRILFCEGTAVIAREKGLLRGWFEDHVLAMLDRRGTEISSLATLARGKTYLEYYIT